MPKQPAKLTAKAVSGKMGKGWHRADANLYVQVDANGNKSWLFRYKIHDKQKAMGLGSLKTLTLAEASEKAADYRRLVKDGIDPLLLRNEKEAQAALAAAKGKTFKQCADAYIEAHKPSWRNPKHIQQWENTLEQYVHPILGKHPAQDIDTPLIMKVLEPIWATKNETASRIRGRIEVVLDWAKTCGFRKGENEARWRGHLEHILAKRSGVHKVKHHPALPYKQVNEFIAAISAEGGIASKALVYTVLTGSRTTEVTDARWDEIDLEAGLWIVPESRTKSKRIHRVTLSDPAKNILKEMLKIKGKEDVFVFPGRRRGKPLSNGAMLMLRKRMGYADAKLNGYITIHGFRSTFRDWAAEQTNFPREVAEAAIAHVVKDQTEAAYRRTDFIDKRRQLVNKWAKYCFTPQLKEKNTDNVIPMRRKKK